MFELNTRGANRLVILTRQHAYKIPTLRNWRDFLFGLLNNMNEARLGRAGLDGYCPVLFAAPGGFLIVMPRACILTEDEFLAFDAVEFCERGEYRINAEHKPDSFGRLGARIVAVDYGW